jgi:hypothetical protein
MPVHFRTCAHCEAINHRDDLRCHKCGSPLSPSPPVRRAAEPAMAGAATTPAWDGRLITPHAYEAAVVRKRSAGSASVTAPIPEPVVEKSGADWESIQRRTGRVRAAVMAVILVTIGAAVYLAQQYPEKWRQGLDAVGSRLIGHSAEPQVTPPPPEPPPSVAPVTPPQSTTPEPPPEVAPEPKPSSPETLARPPPQASPNVRPPSGAKQGSRKSAASKSSARSRAKNPTAPPRPPP